MSFYGNLTTTAAKLLLKYGQVVTLKYDTGGDIDPATGIVTTPPTENIIQGNGVTTNFKNAEIDGTVIKSSDQKLILEKVEVAPEQGWRVQVSSKEYRVMDVNPVSPANEDVIYICQLRV